jgi:elongation factor Ts
MAEGRIKKFYEENTLIDQIFVIDGKTKISKVIETFNSENKCKISIKGFTKFVLGEGIEKTESNFAKEVASFCR